MSAKKVELLCRRDCRLIVDAYIHGLEKSIHCVFHIPQSIIDLCFVFFYAPFIKLQDPSDPWPTPLKILFAMYNCQHCLSIAPGFNLSIDEQCQQLQEFKIATHFQRNDTAKHIINTTKSQCSQLLSTELLKMLSVYHQECQALLSYLIKKSQHDESRNKKNTTHSKIWDFVEYLRIYFQEESIHGYTHIRTYMTHGRIGGIASHIRMMKNVCRKYHLKSGPFSKVKKQLNAWSKSIFEQYQDAIESVPEHWVHNWYWLNNDLQWRQYKASDAYKLSRAWQNPSEGCLVLNEDHRVQFDRSNPEQPTGYQLNNHTSKYGEGSSQNSYTVPVICCNPDDINRIFAQTTLTEKEKTRLLEKKIQSLKLVSKYLSKQLNI